jgi:hypothetical protein
MQVVKTAGVPPNQGRMYFAIYQLHLKQQKRTAKHGKAKERHHRDSRRNYRSLECLGPVSAARQF